MIHSVPSRDNVPRLRTDESYDSGPAWADGLAFEAHGVHFGVRVADPAILSRLYDFLPPRWRRLAGSELLVDRLYSFRPDSTDGTCSFSVDDTLVIDHVSLNDVLSLFEAMVADYLSYFSPTHVFVHAGVVAYRGRAIVLPGDSFAGKTSLVIELVKAGATYYSDEYAVIGDDGRIHPYARPLGVRDLDGLPWQRRPIAHFGGAPGVEPMPLGLVLATQFMPGARWEPREMSRGQGALLLMMHTPAARERPDVVLTTLQRALPGARVLVSPRDDAHEAAQCLLEIASRGWPQP